MSSSSLPFPSSAGRRRASPMTSFSFYEPADLIGTPLIRALTAISAELIGTAPTILQRRNSLSLIRKLRLLHCLFDHLKQTPPPELSPPATICFKEFYILLHRSKALLDYCRHSSRLWVLFLGRKLSGHFQDITRELRTLLDVLPAEEFELGSDVEEQLELLKLQTRNPNLHIEVEDERLLRRIRSFLDHLEKNHLPDKADLREVFSGRLKLADARSYSEEIEFLKEIVGGEKEEIDIAVIDGVIALMRYCSYLLFGPRQETTAAGDGHGDDGEQFANIPKEFCCTISMDLMKDPVVVASGQTYDRPSIAKWFDDGRRTCPNSGQLLKDPHFFPNLALRSLIRQWCSSNGVACDPPRNGGGSPENFTTAVHSKSAMGANRATAELLLQHISARSDEMKAAAVRELRLLTRTGKHNRAIIADAGAVPLLLRLFTSDDGATQENAVTAMLNLSIHHDNKRRVMEEEGCLAAAVEVLRRGLTAEARENAAALLVSLSVVHEHKKVIGGQRGVVIGLSELLSNGTPRGRRDSVMGLYNLATHEQCCEAMVKSGALVALVEALEDDAVAESAAAAVALLARQKVAAERLAWDKAAMETIVEAMRNGRAKVREHAAAVMLEMCRSGGDVVVDVVAGLPALTGAVVSLLVTGTKRARRKAVALDGVLKEKKEEERRSHAAFVPRTAARDGRRPRPGRFPVAVSTYVPVV